MDNGLNSSLFLNDKDDADEPCNVMGSPSLANSNVTSKVEEQKAMVIDRAQSLLCLAMVRLGHEFKHLLCSNSSSIDPDRILELVSRGKEEKKRRKPGIVHHDETKLQEDKDDEEEAWGTCIHLLVI